MGEKPLYGGQAVIEGVMMRGRHFVACAVREPQGDIVVTSEPLSKAIYASSWAKVPFLRAVTILWDTLVLGTKMLMYSANIAVAEDGKATEDRGRTLAPPATVPEATLAPHAHLPRGSAEGSAGERSGRAGETEKEQPSVVGLSSSVDTRSPVVRSASAGDGALPAGVAFGTLAISLAFGIGLFFVLPLFLVSLVDPFLTASFGNTDTASLVSNILEGVIRLVIFLGYIWGISQLPDVRRVFQYHGAEHKTIAADEAGAPLTPESIQRFSKEHPRCGTGFLLVVVVVSILVFALLGRPPIVLRVLSRIVLVPVVAALSYELIKFSSAHKSNPLLNWLVVKPSIALQSLTTREPDEKMILVAVAALQRVQAQENSFSNT